MKIKNTIALLTLTTVMSTTLPVALAATQPLTQATTWTITRGNTLQQIAKATGISIAQLENDNHNVNPSNLQIGTKLQIPARWTVRSGDTLWKIAQATGVTVSALEQANGLRADSVLQVGQRLVLPARTVTKGQGLTTVAPNAGVTTTSKTWTVKSGQTLWVIAKATGTSVASIEQVNHITDPGNLAVGDVLTIPAGSSAAASTAVVSKPLIYTWATNLSSIDDAMSHSAISDISNDNYAFAADGSVVDTTPGAGTVATLTHYGQASHVDVFATVSNWDPTLGNFSGSLATNVLESPSLRASLENNLVSLAVNDGYAGIDLDIEAVPASDEGGFTALVDELGAQLHAVGKKLAVTVPGESGQSYYSAYNLHAIGQAADLVPVMTYDYSWSGGSAGPIAPLPWDKQVIQYVTSQVPSHKVLLGIAAYAYNWYGGTSASTLSLGQVDSLITADHLTPQWDSQDSVPYLQYTHDGDTHTIYYENQTSLDDKMALVRQYNLGGIAFWKAGGENAAFWNAVNKA